MAVHVFVIVLLMLGLTVSDNNRRLVLHSELDIGQALHDIWQELNATKQENLALKAQMAQEIQAIEVNMTQDKQTIIAQMTQENEALKAQMTQEIQTVTSQMTRENQALKSEISHFKSGQGSTYVRWGRTVCDGNGTKEVYSGFTAGSNYDSEGGAASYVCLPETPSWGYYVDGIQNVGGQIYGTEYETNYQALGPHAFGKSMQDQDAPCVVCHSPRATTIMIPGSTSCYPGWTHEYDGYLMTDYYTHNSASDYACVDKNPEAVYHGEADTNGKLFYFTEVHCGTLPCQEYPNGRELACVVCSK